MFKEHPVSTEGCLRKIVLYLICCNPSLPFIAARDMHSSKRTSVKSTPVGWGGYRGGALRLGPTPPKILCPRLSWSLSDDDQDSNPMLKNFGICLWNSMFIYIVHIWQKFNLILWRLVVHICRFATTASQTVNFLAPRRLGALPLRVKRLIF